MHRQGRDVGVLLGGDGGQCMGGQGVHSLFEGSPARPWREGEPRTSRMVFIGRDLDEELLRGGFEVIRPSPPPSPPPRPPLTPSPPVPPLGSGLSAISFQTFTVRPGQVPVAQNFQEASRAAARCTRLHAAAPASSIKLLLNGGIHVFTAAARHVMERLAKDVCDDVHAWTIVCQPEIR